LATSSSHSACLLTVSSLTGRPQRVTGNG
jgi:hypothetical protein